MAKVEEQGAVPTDRAFLVVYSGWTSQCETWLILLEYGRHQPRHIIASLTLERHPNSAKSRPKVSPNRTIARVAKTIAHIVKSSRQTLGDTV